MRFTVSREQLNYIAATQPEVQARLDDVQAQVYGNASRRLAMHRQTGAAQVTKSSGDVDRFVNLDDKNVLSIEFGHMVKGKFENPDKPRYVPGLYILSIAAGADGKG